MSRLASALVTTLFVWAQLCYANDVSKTVEENKIEIDVRCEEERPFYSDTYITCMQCRTSADCPKHGEICYNGECSFTCPPGSYKTLETINPGYYIDLDLEINTGDVWKAFSDDDNSDARKKVRDQFIDFNKRNQDKYFEKGSTVPNKNGIAMPVCKCSAEASYKKPVHSWTMGTVPGHPFSNVCACDAESGYCEGFVALSYVGGSESLVPRGKSANCWGETSSLRLRLVGLTFVALGIAAFAYRSSSGILSDFHRMNLWNIICTWVFVFTYMIDDPHQGGYTRFLGAGIFLHNAAEWNFMIRLWFGHSLKTRQIMSWWGMMFLAIMMILIMLLPLQTQLVIAGTLGAMLDVTFILMCYAMIVEAKENEEPATSFIRQSLRAGESRFTGLLYLIAFLAHLLALQSIFGAMSSGNLTVQTWILFIIFTFFEFILLEMFAYNQDHRAVWCMPYDQSSYDFVEVNEDKHQYMLVDNVEATSTANAGILVKTIVDGEFDSNPEVHSGRPDRLVYDLGVYPDGLNERIRGCKECPRCEACCSPKIPPFAIYLSIGFIAALLINLFLFVIQPQGVDFENMNVGDCPQYYPIHGNHGVPAWLAHMPLDHPFRLQYADIFVQSINNSMNTIGIIVSIVLFALLLVLIRIQVSYVKDLGGSGTIRENIYHQRDMESVPAVGKMTSPNIPPTAGGNGDLEMSVMKEDSRDSRNMEREV